VIVLGIDPGTAALGYGIVDASGGRMREVDHGCLLTSPDRSLPERLLEIHALVGELVARHQPDVLAVERLFFSKNVQTAFAVGQARGVVLLAAAQHGVPVREATPNEVKSAIAGYGAADKAQVQRMVQMVLGMAELPRPDDAADALAIAVWGANTEGSVVARAAAVGAAEAAEAAGAGGRGVGGGAGGGGVADGSSAGGGAATAGVLDRAAVAPITRGSTGYERAVREAIALERVKRGAS